MEPDELTIKETAVAARPRTARVTDAEAPEVLFAGVIPAVGGKAFITVRLAAAFADYVVEAVALAGGDWATAEARFRAEKETFADLALPAFVHPEDTAIGRLHVGSASGRMRVSLRRDGPTASLLLDGRPIEDGEVLPVGRAELTFYAEPGEYRASIEDLETGAVESAVGRVEVPGKLRRLARTLAFLEPGESLSREADPKIVGLRVLPGVDGTFRVLVDATADYAHACCEQTAAKILAACAMYAFADSDAERRQKAEEIIIAGVRREESMFLPSRGFKMYPEGPDEPHDYYGPKTARYLWNLGLLKDIGRPSDALLQAVDRGLGMAADATRAYRQDWPPRKLDSCENAYAAFRFGEGGAARDAALDTARSYATAPAHSNLSGAVLERCETAYAAATLLRAGASADRRSALGLSNAVLKDLDGNGRLYSTVDSVAAVALLAEIRAARVAGNGVVSVRIRGDEGGDGRRLTLDLKVELKEGYKEGDLAWVCLPAALSRVIGGGQVKRFSLDFEGKDEIEVPLAVTSSTVDRLGDPAPQRFAVSIRNMFEEERAANPGLLQVLAVHRS